MTVAIGEDKPLVLSFSLFLSPRLSSEDRAHTSRRKREEKEEQQIIFSPIFFFSFLVFFFLVACCCCCREWAGGGPSSFWQHHWRSLLSSLLEGIQKIKKNTLSFFFFFSRSRANLDLRSSNRSSSTHSIYLNQSIFLSIFNQSIFVFSFLSHVYLSLVYLSLICLQCLRVCLLVLFCLLGGVYSDAGDVEKSNDLLIRLAQDFLRRQRRRARTRILPPINK